MQGKERAELNIGIGWRGLVDEMERFKDNMEFTKLKTNQQGVDPDDVYSSVPYEKGFQFLCRIERQVSIRFVLREQFVIMLVSHFPEETLFSLCCVRR